MYWWFIVQGEGGGVQRAYEHPEVQVLLGRGLGVPACQGHREEHRAHHPEQRPTEEGQPSINFFFLFSSFQKPQVMNYKVIF